MKNLVLSSLFALISTNAFAGRDVRVVCDFSQTAFGFEHKVDGIDIDGKGDGSIRVRYQDGSMENLPPVPGRGGPFGEIKFPSKIGEDGWLSVKYAQAQSANLGLFQIKYICENFQSNGYTCYVGSADHGGPSTLERVWFNFNGKSVAFRGDSLPYCLIESI